MASRKIKWDNADGICGTLFAPESDWVPPTSFPNLSACRTIGLDIESRDPDLMTKGPGFIRGNADVAGISVSTTDASWYFPIGHLSGGNINKIATIVWLQHELLCREDLTIIGANLQYELEGLDSLGIQIRGNLIDVQIAEALIDENSESTSLEALCKKYLGGSKDEALLKEAAAAHGFKHEKSSLWKLHSKYVGPYAEYDAQAPLKIWEAQKKIISNESLDRVFALESKLLPMIWRMRKRGICLDVEAAQGLSGRLLLEENQMRLDMRKKYGTEVDPQSGPKIALICDRLGIRYPRTAIGNPSFTADYLENANHPFLDDLAALRKLNDLRNDFVDGWLLKHHIGGKIHPQWRQIATDEGGTRTGRFGCANPNVQQIPAGKYRKTGKPNTIGQMIRACFIPHERGLKWAKFDYSEQEPRILTHFAALCNFTGACEVARKYSESRLFKIYPFMMEISGLDKRPAKDCYLGRSYGMGIKKLALKFNKSEDEARKILAKFDAGVPFVKELAEAASHAAQERGYVRTLLGRRRHFNMWEPANSWRLRKDDPSMDCRPVKTQEAAERKWPGTKLQRADTHKACNSVIQGSGADMAKQAMVDCYEKNSILPYMQVHDELNFGVQDEQHALQLQSSIEGCIPMEVPIVSNLEIGEHWK
jgi:DNA polymerase I-like protein with 3'-5' exonuclease and polymerase domains